MEKIFKKVKIIQVVEIEYEIKNENCPMPVRTIKEYQTLDKEVIGKLDPLEKYKSFLEPYKYEKK